MEAEGLGFTVKSECSFQEEDTVSPNKNLTRTMIKVNAEVKDEMSTECFQSHLLHQKEASAMPSFLQSSSNFITSHCEAMGVSQQQQEEFLEFKTQMVLKSEPNMSTDNNFDNKIHVLRNVNDVHQYHPSMTDPEQLDQVKVYKCNVCPYSCNLLFDLHQHYISHTLETLYICDLCQYSCQSFLDLGCHLVSHAVNDKNSFQQLHGSKKKSRKYNTSKKKHSCDLCQYTCVLPSELRTHKRIHTGEKPYSCDSCGYASARLANLTVHKKKHTGEYLMCDVCGYTCIQSWDLKQHKRGHTGEKPFCCDYCGRTFSCMGNLKSHRRTHTGEKPYSCDLCDYSCGQVSNLSRHKRTHHSCEKRFSSDLSAYKKNVRPKQNKKYNRKVIVNKPLICNFCNYTCVFPHYMKIHQRQHTGEKPYSCDRCDCTYAHLTALNGHISRHHTKRTCDVCDYTCEQVSELRKHKKRHHPVKKTRTCHLCDYTCTRKYHMERHKRRHTGEKPYSCDLCGHTGAHRWDIIRHLKKHTGEKPFSCDLCDHTCVTLSNLKQHKRKHRGETSLLQ